MPPKTSQPLKNSSLNPKPAQQPSTDNDQPITIQTQQDLKANPVEISSAQAELYFQYLRKKISNQTNDPFSLPFLNLKFEQLDSWKGATEQLTIDSRIYGMRVDNCHDNAIKMLNYVIRNQQTEIGKDTGAAQKQAKQEEPTTNQSHKNNHNFHLQKPQKINATQIGAGSQLQNVSFWMAVFKKSQSLAHIQLNTVELSTNLKLELDFKLTSYKSMDFQEKKIIKGAFLESNDIFLGLPTVTVGLQIFKEIEQIKKEVQEDLEEIVDKRKQAREKKGEQEIEQGMWEINLGMRDIDFQEFYQEFNEFENNFGEGKPEKASQESIFQQGFQDEPKENAFFPQFGRGGRQLRSIPIDPLNDDTSEYQEANEDEHEPNELYEPQKDMFFNTSYRRERKVATKVKGKGKRSKRVNVIDFSNTQRIFGRKKAFNSEPMIKPRFRNDNLVPISYVVIYEGRNPFKKLKKVQRANGRVNMYDPASNMNFFETQELSRPMDFMPLNTSYEMQQPTMMLSYQEHEHNQDENRQEGEKYMKNVPIKMVKQEIIKEIRNCDRSMMLSRPLGVSNQSEVGENGEDLSCMETCLQEEAMMIGLKFFKEKMRQFDPLDLLVSLLHVAFEEQVILQPVYGTGNGEELNGQKPELRDILIQVDHFN